MSTAPAAPPERGTSLERELKFVLPAGQASFARAIVSAFCRPDPEFPAAIVSTIYYDTPDFELLGEKVNSDYLKTKVRLRWYSPSRGATTAYLEIKSRVGSLRSKVRVNTPIAGAAADTLALDDPRLIDILELARPLGVPVPARLMPAMLLRYARFRYVEPVSGSRISVDTDIETVRGNPRFMANAAPVRLPVAVIETKGEGIELPRALHQLIGLGARRASFSKYAATGLAMLRYTH